MKNSKVDCIFSIFAFYWGNNIKEQNKEANRVLKGGEFVVTLPSEHLSDMHHAYNLSRNMKISSNLRELLSDMNEIDKNLFLSMVEKFKPGKNF